MTKLRYFEAKKRISGKTDYYYHLPKKISSKYELPSSISLGKCYNTAVQKWAELNKQLEHAEEYYKKYGTPPVFKAEVNEGTFEHISELYINDRKFIRLAPRTQQGYLSLIKRFNHTILFDGQSQPFGTLKVEAIDRLFCKKFYEKLLIKGQKRGAEDFIKVLRNLLNIAIDYGYIKGENPCSKLVIEKNKPRHQVWTQEEFQIFCNTTQERNLNGLCVAMNLAMFTAQRQTDILNLKWSDITDDFRTMYIIQSKTKSKIELPLDKIPTLQNLLRSLERKSNYIVIDEFDNKPYFDRIRLFADRYEKIRILSGIRQDLLFRDLRRTAILKLDEVGCTPGEISSISGHSRKTILDMLEIYAPKSRKKAEGAFGRMEYKI